ALTGEKNRSGTFSVTSPGRSRLRQVRPEPAPGSEDFTRGFIPPPTRGLNPGGVAGLEPRVEFAEPGASWPPTIADKLLPTESFCPRRAGPKMAVACLWPGSAVHKLGEARHRTRHRYSRGDRRVRRRCQGKVRSPTGSPCSRPGTPRRPSPSGSATSAAW